MMRIFTNLILGSGLVAIHAHFNWSQWLWLQTLSSTWLRWMHKIGVCVYERAVAKVKPS